MAAAGLLDDIGRCRVMGVVNVTPDSFSDGGSFEDSEAAVTHGLLLVAQGADIVDVGGESTRPGAARVPVEEEISRTRDVVAGLAAAGATVSIDTSRGAVAQAAIDAGAAMVNDVSGGVDPDLLAVVAQTGVPYVLMHTRGDSAQMSSLATYDDVVRDVVTELLDRLDAVVAAGVSRDQVVIDPGFGFAKLGRQNWALLDALGAFVALGPPVLVGTSRKSFLGTALVAPDGTPRPVALREDATQATTAIAAREGAWGVRVHKVPPAADAVRIVAAMAAARGRNEP